MFQPNERSAPSYHYHVEQKPAQGDRVENFLIAFAAILRHSNYRFLLDMYAHTSTKCARCAVTCQVYQASGEPRDVPCYRSNLLLDVYRRHFTPSGWLARPFLGPEKKSTKWPSCSIVARPASVANWSVHWALITDCWLAWAAIF